MTLSPRLRWALGLTLLASLGVALTDAPDAVPVAPGAAARRAAAPAAAAASSGSTAAWPDRPTRTAPSAWPGPDPRALAAWSPVAPPAASAPQPRAVAAVAVAPAPPPPPAAPVAPPFPYQLIGRVDDNGSSQALLMGATQTLGVRAGDVVDGQWRIDTVGSAGVTLTWMPGASQQTLTFRPS